MNVKKMFEDHFAKHGGPTSGYENTEATRSESVQAGAETELLPANVKVRLMEPTVEHSRSSLFSTERLHLAAYLLATEQLQFSHCAYSPLGRVFFVSHDPGQMGAKLAWEFERGGVLPAISVLASERLLRSKMSEALDTTRTSAQPDLLRAAVNIGQGLWHKILFSLVGFGVDAITIAGENAHLRINQPVAFPEQAIIGSLGELALELSKGTEVPQEFIFATALTCFGAIASGQLKLNIGMDSDTRLFTVLLGKSASAKKSSAMARTIEYFQKLNSAVQWRALVSASVEPKGLQRSFWHIGAYCLPLMNFALLSTRRGSRLQCCCPWLLRCLRNIRGTTRANWALYPSAMLGCLLSVAAPRTPMTICGPLRRLQSECLTGCLWLMPTQNRR